MKRAIALGIAAIAMTGCQSMPDWFKPKIKVPYFEPLTAAQLCGGFNRYCQPTSSTTFERLREPTDFFDGKPAALLGRSYSMIYETAACTSVPNFVNRNSTDDDVTYSGQSGVVGTVASESQSAFNAGVSADIDKFVAETFPNFPQEFQAAAKAKLESKMQSALQQNASITYHRMDLTQAFIDAHLGECLDKLPSNRKVITGVSMITVSGDWSQTILRDILTELEASAEYRSLSADLKASYTQRKSIALQGTFEPLAVPFAVAFRRGRAAAQ